MFSYEQFQQNNEFQPNSPTAQQLNSPTAQQPNSPIKKLNYKWLLFCLIFLLFFSSEYLLGQCTVHNVDLVGSTVTPVSANTPQGQTFLACMDGEISSVSIGLGSGSQAGTYELYLAIEPGSGSAIPAIPVASIIQGTALGANQILTFNLGTPFPVLNDGTIYRFVVTNTTGSFRIVFQNPGDYPDGVITTNSHDYFSPADRDFEVNIQPASSSPADIPTLSEWGLLILALLLMTLGTLYLVQPKFRGGVFEQER